MLRSGTSERLVAAGTLTECKTGGSRVCDGAVTKELKSTNPSVQAVYWWKKTEEWNQLKNRFI